MTDIKNEEAGEKKSLNFIEQAVEKDLKEGKNGGKVQIPSHRSCQSYLP